MTTPDKIPDSISAGKATEPLDKSVPSGKTPSGFDSYMQGSGSKAQGGAGGGQVRGPTPMDIAQGASINTSAVSYDTILNQSKQMQDSLGTVEQQLNDPKLKLKRSQNHLVKQKLGDANSHIRAAGSKLGLDMQEGSVPPGTSALGRFIAMVNDGQDQLEGVQKKLQEMSASGANVSPADMLTIQVKMGLANQEIQYTSTILGKVIQSVTQLLSTQL